MQDNRFQTIEFPGSGLDKDSDMRLMRPGDSRYRLNCLIGSTDDGRSGDIQNVLGNTQVPHTPPAGINTTIGSCQDTQNNAIIYFVYNSAGNHHIRRIFPDTGADELILQNNTLNFQLSNRIYHADIIDGLLYWTDGWFESYEFDNNGLLQFNPPRKINIEKAKNGDYNTVDFEVLDRIKYQPALPATLRYIYDPGQIENYIDGKLFQFTYRYIFDDKEESTWASLSKALLPMFNYKNGSPGNLLENTIGVTIGSGSEIVTDIEIGIRLNGFYFIVSKLNKAELSIPDNTDYEYVYNGFAYKENLPIDAFLRPYDYVPQISKCQEIAGGRMTDANIVEGYDEIDTDMSFEFIRYNKTLDVRTTSPDPSNPVVPNSFIPWGFSQDLEYPIPDFKDRGVYQVGIVYKDRAKRSGDVNTKEEYIQITPSRDDGAFPTNGMNMDPLKLRYEINHIPPVWAKYYSVVITKDQRYLKKQQMMLTARNFNLKDGKIRLSTTEPYSFTEGDYIRLVAYMNPQSTNNPDLFSFNLQLNDNFMTPFTGSDNNLYQASTTTFNYKIQEIDNLTGELVVSSEDAEDMRTYIQGELLPDPEKDAAFGFYSSFYYLVEIYNDNKNTTENKIFYEIAEEFEIGDPYTDDRYHKCSVQDQIPGSQPAIGDIFGFDCYLRRKKQTLDDQTVVLEILNPAVDFIYSTNNNEVHFPIQFLQAFNESTLDIQGDYTGVALWLTAAGNLFGGYVGFDQPILSGLPNDIMLLNNNGSFQPLPPGNELPYWLMFFGQIEIYVWMEDESFSDDYPSHVYNDGRVNTNLTQSKRQEFISRVRWGGSLFESTDINELSTFLVESFTDLSQTYNEINKIFQIGDTLKAEQRNKMNSFYINRQVYQDSEGSDQVVQSNQFLSVPNIYDENFGCYHPGSVAVSTRTSYFADATNGKIIRDAGNKPIAISGEERNPNDVFRMSNYFKDLLENVRKLGDEVNVISCWDDYNQLYTFTVQDLREEFSPIPDQSQTIVFHEPTNRWISFMSYVPEWYETIGKYVVSFKNGQPYLHYSNALRNYFYGTQYGQQADIICNLGRNTVKVFKNLDLYSNVAWDAFEINIPASPNLPTGMQSRIPKAKFVPKEGVYHASFLRDMTDPSYSNQVAAIINGRRLRGEVIEIKLSNTETSLVYLKALNIFVLPSEPTI